MLFEEKNTVIVVWVGKENSRLSMGRDKNLLLFGDKNSHKQGVKTICCLGEIKTAYVYEEISIKWQKFVYPGIDRNIVFIYSDKNFI